MIISGEITLPAPREIVFQALQNAPFFASCVEGVRVSRRSTPLITMRFWTPRSPT
jgi:carbon monoxide dehydrogenase subunit G